MRALAALWGAMAKFATELARGLALALAALAAIDLARAAQGLSPFWWLGPAHPALGLTLRLAVVGLLTAYVARPAMGRPRRLATISVVLVAAVVAARDVLSFYALASGGQIAVGAPLPLSLAICALLLVLAAAIGRGARAAGPPLAASVVAATVLGAFALGQMLTFGPTGYARQADAVVVLGARVYADGTASLALADRVRTGCELVRAGYAPVLIVSGGPGDGDTHETGAMKRIARACGVAEAAIVIDLDGLSTWHTARNVAALDRELRVIAVSHAYHLPRVKLAFDRAGVEAYTVPARETRTLAKLPYYMAREVLAFWVYYLAPAH